MAGRGGAARPNGPAAGNKICQFKLVLLGESAVGKSSLVLRFVKGQFHEYQESTIGGEWAQGSGAASGMPKKCLGVEKEAACPEGLNVPAAAAPLPHLGPGIKSNSWSPCRSPHRHPVRLSWESKTGFSSRLCHCTVAWPWLRAFH